MRRWCQLPLAVSLPHRGEPAGLGVEVGHMVQAVPFQVWVKPDVADVACDC